jgi:hypothetical protein
MLSKSEIQKCKSVIKETFVDWFAFIFQSHIYY